MHLFEDGNINHVEIQKIPAKKISFVVLKNVHSTLYSESFILNAKSSAATFVQCSSYLRFSGEHFLDKLAESIFQSPEN